MANRGALLLLATLTAVGTLSIGLSSGERPDRLAMTAAIYEAALRELSPGKQQVVQTAVPAAVPAWTGESRIIHLGPEALDAILTRGPEEHPVDPWERFRARYPDSHGYFHLAVPLIEDGGLSAKLKVSSYSGFLSAWGQTWTLERDSLNAPWRLTLRAPGWVS